MADTKPYEVAFTGTVTPAATKFLKSGPLVMDFTGTLDLDDTDVANLDIIQTTFQKEMGERIKEQLKHLNTWLTEKDQLIASMQKRFDELQKAGIPATPQEATKRQKEIQEMEKLAEAIQKLPEDYKQIVQDWAENARQQQALVCMMTAVKKARVQTFTNKKWRVRLGLALKVVLVVAAIALSIAAIVLTAGTTAPIFIGLAAAGVAISGIASFTQLGKALVENANIEKKLMSALSKDVEGVKTALKPLDGAKSSIAKHVTELRNLLKIREDNVRELTMELKKHGVSVTSYEKSLDQLKQDKSVPVGDIAKREKKLDELIAQRKSVEDQIAKLKQDIVAGQKVLDELAALGVELDKISGQTANSVLGNLKTRFSTLDGWLDLGNTIGGLTSAASGVHK